jgi:hypothetical protein
MNRRRLALVLPVLLVALGCFVGAHLYLAQRLLHDPGVPQPWRGLGLLLLALLALCILAEPAAGRFLSRRSSRALAWPASLWMGLAFLLVVALAAADAVFALAGGAASAAGFEPGAAEPLARARALIALAVAGTGTALALRGGLRAPELRRVELRLPRWPRELDGLRVAQISDLHIGPILDRAFLAGVVKRVNELEADLVAVTGDLVDGPVARLREEVAPLADLRARLGVYFVTGNHDHYSGAAAWVARVQELGLRALRNERVALGSGNASFDLIGVDDHRGDLLGGEGGEDLERALAGRDPARFGLLLAHDPTTFRRASQLGIDLQLSGHTHGGQIWPFGHLVRLVVPWLAGPHRAGPAQLYVSRGTGFWGPAMRLAAPAEITELVLRSAA